MRIVFNVVLAAGLVSLGAHSARAAEPQEPWVDAPAFSVVPEVLLAKVEQLPRPDSSAEVLLEDMRIALDERGGAARTFHTIYRVLNATGVETRSSFSIGWSPWRQARPSIRARVISADGVVHEFDQATLADAPMGNDEDNVFSDRRVVEGPLPAVAPGSIVEYEWTLADTAPSAELGSSGQWFFGDSVPVRHTRFFLSAPESSPPTTRAYNLDSTSPTRETRDGRVSISFDAGPMPKTPELAAWVPYDVRQRSSVGYATAGTWARVATAYAATVDRQIASARVGSEVGAVLHGVEGRTARIEALVRHLHRLVRYTGVEFGESSITPARPEETLKRRFGDCKDKSTLLVALLRAAGFDAHVALLSVGYAPDLDADLPGIDLFNHAIVFVGGDPPVWIDATAEHLRVGDLPAAVAGRLALIASAPSDALVRIPDMPSARNRIERVRDFYIAERGRGRVVETIRPEGILEGEYRGKYSGMVESEVKKNLGLVAKDVLKSRSVGELHYTEAADFSKPFSVSVEGKETAVGETALDASIVRFPPADFVARLSEQLPAEETSGDTDAKSQHAARVLPFRLQHAFVDVWTARVHPPAGFVPGEPPQVEDTRIGPVRFTRTYEAAPDGSIAFSATLDTGDRLVWSPQELADVRAWITKVKASETVQLVFEQIGYKSLRAGKIQDAVLEYRRLAALHPTEALHHCQLADAYLRGGVGEAARDEARRAVQLEPSSAEPWRILGWVNINDIIGRPFMKGSDLAEAERAYRKAAELEPKDELARKNLAILLEYDPATMTRYERGARLPEAIDTWRALRKDLDTKANDASLMVVLARAERWKDLQEFARDAQGAETRDVWIVASTAILAGTDEAIAESGRQTSVRSARDKLLLSAAGTLLQLRHYSEAAALMRAGSEAAPQGAAAAKTQAELIGRCRRHEDVSLGEDTPEALIRRFFTNVLARHDPDTSERDLSSIALETSTRSNLADQARSGATSFRSIAAGSGMSLDGIADIVLAVTEMRTEGDDSLGFKTTMTLNVPGQSQTTVWFTQREGGALKIVATSDDVTPLGVVALSRLDAGRPEDARKWLTWAHDALPPARADFVADHPFVSFWPPDPTRGDEALALAAAALVARGPDTTMGLPILERARRDATGDAGARIDHALSDAYFTLKRSSDGIEAARRLHAAVPTSDPAFDRLVANLMRDERYDEVEALCAERAVTTPDDFRLWRTRARLESARRRWKDAETAWRHIVDLGKADADVYNSLAWEALFLGHPSDQTFADGERAALFRKEPPWGYLHTLAAVYADAGRVVDARETLVKEFVARGIEEPGPFEWLVIGRLAEQYGANEQALAAYRRVTKPGEKWDLSGSAYELAQRWMSDLVSSNSGPIPRSASGKTRNSPK